MFINKNNRKVYNKIVSYKLQVCVCVLHGHVPSKIWEKDRQQSVRNGCTSFCSIRASQS